MKKNLLIYAFAVLFGFTFLNNNNAQIYKNVYLDAMFYNYGYNQNSYLNCWSYMYDDETNLHFSFQPYDTTNCNDIAYLDSTGNLELIKAKMNIDFTSIDQYKPSYINLELNNITDSARLMVYSEGSKIKDTILLPTSYYYYFDDLNSNIILDSIVIASNSCKISYSSSFDFKPAFMPKANAEFCPGQKIHFNFPHNYMDIKWDFGDGYVDYWSQPEHVYQDTGTYQVKCTYTVDNYGFPMTDSIVQPIKITGGAKTKPIIFTESFPEGCINDDFTFNVNNAARYNDFTWYFGDGQTSKLQRPTYAYSDSGTYKVTLKATNPCGNSAISDTLHINVFNQSPEQGEWVNFFFNHSGMSICPGTQINFQNETSAQYFEWDFGDGTYSEEKNPVKHYTDTGWYNVQLTAINGCGDKDSMMNSIQVKYDTNEILQTPYFSFDMEDYDNYTDTLTICKGEKVKFRNESSFNNDIALEWDFGDGVKSSIMSPSHIYSTEGLKEVRLTAYSPCGGSSHISRRVDVRNDIQPNVQLMVVPHEICPGDKVYFMDNENWINDKTGMFKYSYDINFGDGDSLTNIKTLDPNAKVEVLAAHKYLTANTYNFTFTAKNACGNETTYQDSIIVKNDAANVPFVYANNSTQQDGPLGGFYNDWSISRDTATEHELEIPVEWNRDLEWPDNSTYYVFFWYGQLDTNNPGPPNGMVKFEETNDFFQDTIRAFVPIDPLYPRSVGLGVLWYCNPVNYEYRSGEKELDEPTVYGVPMNSQGLVLSFPIQKGGYTMVSDSTTDGMPVVIDPSSSYTGECNPFDGEWFYASATNEKAYLELYNDKTYNMRYQLDDYMGERYISHGTYQVHDTTISFTGGGLCDTFDMGDYIFHKTDSTLNFTPDPFGSQYCSPRKEFLTKGTFTEAPRDGWNSGKENYTGCPGDKIKFTAAGGNTYEWHFGDGNAPVNQQIAWHQYSNYGKYDAYVITTNGCGRTDTTWTTVVIDSTNKSDAHFYWQEGYPQRGDSIHFIYSDRKDDPAQYFNYKWDFGDGTTSTKMNPVHVYNANGDYTITLTVTNGCGSATNKQTIYIEGMQRRCDSLIDAFFGYKTDTTNNLKVNFHDHSFGNISGWYWNFGNGKTSKKPQPSVIYNYPGTYEVCLNVWDSTTGCSGQFCDFIKVGATCNTDFSFVVNNTTNKAEFVDETEHLQNATYKEWMWEFGDGTFDTVPAPIHQYSEPGLYMVCLHTYNYNGNTQKECMDEICKMIQVGEADSNLLIADFFFSVDPDSARTVHFFEAATGVVTDGHWDFGDGTYAHEPNPTHTYRDTGLYEVCATVYNEYTGKQSSKCKEVLLGSSPCKAGFNYHIDPVTNNVKFSNKSSGNITGYYWDFGDGNWSDTVSPANKYQEPGTYTVCLHISNEATGCHSEMCKEVTITPMNQKILTADFTYMSNTNNYEVVFNNASTGDVSNSYWTFGDGSFVEQQNPKHTYTYPGSYNVCLNVFSDSTGEQAKKCKDVIVGTSACNLEAKFAYFIDNTNKKVTLSDNSKGGVNKWFWNFGDGTTSSKKNPVKYFTEPGFYLISLSVTDTMSKCKDYFAKFIQVGNAECKAKFDYTVDVPNKKVTFEDKSIGSISNYLWLFDDGNYATAQHPVHTYAKNNLYNVGLTVSSANCMNHIDELIQIGQVNCNAGFDVFVDSTSKKASFINHTTDSSLIMYWIFGDGTVSTKMNPEHTFPAPGYYTVSLNTFDDVTGCMDYHEEKVLVSSTGDDCYANFLYTVGPVVNDEAVVNFRNMSSTGSSLWNFGYKNTGGNNYEPKTSTERNPQVTLNRGYHNICLTLKEGGCQDIVCKPVKVEPDVIRACKADFYFNVASDNKVYFKDNSIGNVTSYNWEFGDNSTSTEASPTHQYNASDYYLAKLTIETAGGCKSSQYKLVNANAGSGLTALFGHEETDTTLKATGYPVDFVGISHGDAAKLKWDFDNDGVYDDTTSKTPTYTYDEPGTYLACLTVEDPVTGQVDTYCDTVKVGSTDNVEEIANVQPEMNIYPNPLIGQYVYIKYELKQASDVEIVILNASSSMIEKLVQTSKVPGKYKLIKNMDGFAAGTYYFQLKTQYGSAVKKLVIEE